MLIRTFYKRLKEEGINLYRTFSDENFYIKQLPTEILYQEAIDIESAPYTYEETDIKIEEEDGRDSRGNEEDSTLYS